MTRRGSRERFEDIRAAATDALDFCDGLDEAAFIAMLMPDRRTYRALKKGSPHRLLKTAR